MTQLSLLDNFWDEHPMGKIKKWGGGLGLSLGAWLDPLCGPVVSMQQALDQ